MMKSADIIRRLIDAGFVHTRTKGSHHIFTKPGHPFPVSVPHPKDVPIGTVKKIEKDSGVKLR